MSEYQNADDLCQSVVTRASFTQRLRGEDARTPANRDRSKKKTLLAAVVVLALLIVAVIGVASYRVYYDSTLPGQIDRMEQADYLDLSGENASLLKLLDGKSVRGADCAGYGYEKC